jgi:predicted dehydrogenase
MSSNTDKIRVGVVGVGRGQAFARSSGLAGMELVAICDTWEERLERVGRELGTTTYTRFDDLLEHDLDAVILANYFHEHAPLAIKALNAGKHVMSETSACHTMAEGVELARAVERTGKTYFLAENYPYMAPNQEMRRLYREGVLGKFMYGEAEYVHPDTAQAKMARSCGMDHWRNWIPATYYCTHSIGPVMFITDTMPVQVSAFVIPIDHEDPTLNMTVRRNDTAAVLMLHMDSGAVAKSLHGGLRGHQNYTRIHGNKGLVESARAGNSGMIRLRREPFDKSPGEPLEQLYTPEFAAEHAHALRAGHGGGDYFMNHHFAEAIRTGEAPYLDVYRGVAMSACGILGWRSALQGSAPVPVPDFRDEAQRTAFENDHWSPDPTRAGAERPPCSILGEHSASGEAITFSRQVWAAEGYQEPGASQG